jgi:glycosyltransferase involved in cell wall biosynthesis
MARPLVSIIVPAYNSGRYLAETLDSALRQTYPHREIIVVDDGSTDQTSQRVEHYRPGVTYIRQERAGVGAARNRGLHAARGDYVALLDHDDLWLPEKLEVQVEVAERHPETAMVVCDGVQFDGETVLASHLFRGDLLDELARSPDGELTGNLYRDLVRSNMISCPAQTLIRRRVVHELGPLTTIQYEAADYDYYLRIARDYPLTLHQHSLVRWRYLPSSRSGPAERRQFQWALMSVPVLRRQQRLCRDEDRPFVTSVVRAFIRQQARVTYQYGRLHDRAYARSVLRRLARYTPLDMKVLICLAAASLPPTLIDFVAQRTRGLRQAAGSNRHQRSSRSRS